MRRIAAGAADDHFVFGDQRRRGDGAAALARVVEADSPGLFAGFLIDRQQVVVIGADEHFAVAYRDAAILRAVSERFRAAADT